MSRAIFLGSFNPPHQGHKDVIQSVIDSGIMNELNIDKIHVIPCWQNPNKSKTLDFVDRLTMCMLEFADLVDYGVLVDDVERYEKPEYTYHLLDHFHSGEDDFIKDDFYWIITEETINELFDGKWKEYDRLLQENKFIVVEKDLKNSPHYYDVWVKQIQLKSTSNVHSTDIRNNFWVNAKYDSDIDEKVKNYIIDHNLYK